MVVHKLDAVKKVYVGMHVATKLATSHCGKQMWLGDSPEERLSEVWKNVTCKRCLKLKLKKQIVF